jgi:hypothetical protein
LAPVKWNGDTTASKSFGGRRIAVASDNSTGAVYVLDNSDGVVDKFTAEGELVKSFGDSTPSHNGQLAGREAIPDGAFNSPKGIAVDQATDDLYVLDSGHQVVDVFSAEGAFLTSFNGSNTTVGSFSVEYADGIAIDDENSHILVSDSAQPATFDFASTTDTEPATWNGSAATNPPGTPAGSFGTGFTSVAADNASGDVFITDSTDEVVDAFNAEGGYIGQIQGVALAPRGGVAVDQATGEVYVSDDNHGSSGDEASVRIFETDTVPDVVTEAASGVGLSSAILNGSVNPVGEGPVKCQFVWGASKAFGHVAPCSEEVANGSGTVVVHADLSKLEVDTEYCYRLQASDANGANPGEEFQDQCFTTLGVGVGEVSVTEVTAESVTFHAVIDPNGKPTTYYFQYGLTTGYGSDAPAVAGASAGSAKGFAEVTPEYAEGLLAASLYHYRIVAVSEVEPGRVEEFFGPDQTLMTHGVSGEALLPDGRAWELVSPVDKHGALIDPIAEVGVIQAAAEGNAFSYLASAPTEAEPAGFANRTQVLSTRGAEGWESRDISIPHAGGTGKSVSVGEEYRFFSEDLSLAVVQPFGAFLPCKVGGKPQPCLSPGASEQAAFLRTDMGAAAGSFQPLVAGCPPPSQACPPAIAADSNVPAGTVFGATSVATGEACPPARYCGPEFVGASPNGKQVVLKWRNALTKTTLPAVNGGLYEWSEGNLELVSVLPDEEPASERENPELGIQSEAERGAVSEDGSRVVWTTEGSPALYMRDLATDETVQLDAPEEGCQGGCGSGDGRFQFASADGARVFFTDTQKLTNDSGSSFEHGKADLYECEIVVDGEGGLHCKLTDLTPLGSGNEPAEVLGGVSGASSDGSWVYFVADGVLSNAGAPVAGAARGTCGDSAVSLAAQMCNLYVNHDGVTRLVAVLSAEDAPDWSEGLVGLTARVSADGEWLAFMSQRPLTGYDNTDANSGQPDEEVFVYHAPGSLAAEAGMLACASCDPSGARPTGVEYGPEPTLTGGFRVWVGRWLAANVPGWTPYRLGSALYQSRYLSDSGRLFFNGSSALVPQDVNGQEDVYEWEPEGVPVGSGHACSSATQSGGEVFKPAHAFHVPAQGAAPSSEGEEPAGCVGLISSGRSGGESAFLDASADGSDVFFMTSGRLVPQAGEATTAVYDAHECSSGWACPSSAAVLPPACDTEASCKAAPSPQPEVFGAPSSATFSGPGNSAPLVVPSKPKVETKAEKLGKALRTCRKDRSKKKRRSCEAVAKRRYGAKSSRSAKKSSHRGAK